MSNSSSSSSGIGFVGVLTIAFIVLKLLDFIDWSWWWVLSPLWIAPVFFLVIILGGAALFTWLNNRELRKRK